jgi:hypothetical protein
MDLMCVCMYVCMYEHSHDCEGGVLEVGELSFHGPDVHVYVCMHVFMYGCMYVCMTMTKSVSSAAMEMMCACVNMHACMYVCMTMTKSVR